jgi:hypothetical protein
MRRLDWPERLAEHLAQAEQRSFSESYCCVVFAADGVLAMTDVDPLPERDETVSASYARMRREGYESIADALAGRFGAPIALAFARRGDVILGKPGDSEAVGICCGQFTAYISASGLEYRPTLDQIAAFRVR